jgi:hypothetical protein
MNQTTAIGVAVLMCVGAWWMSQSAFEAQTEAAKQIQGQSATSGQSQFPQAYDGWKPEEIKAHKDTLRKLGEGFRKEMVRNILAPQPSRIPQVPSLPSIPGLSH